MLLKKKEKKKMEEGGWGWNKWSFDEREEKKGNISIKSYLKSWSNV